MCPKLHNSVLAYNDMHIMFVESKIADLLTKDGNRQSGHVYICLPNRRPYMYHTLSGSSSTKGTRIFQLIDEEVVKLRNRGLYQMEDICLWKRENGEYREGFSTLQTWNVIRVHSPKVPWYKGVWFSGATPEFSFLVWIAIHNRLATGDRVLRWNPQAISTCWLCQRATETRDICSLTAYSKEVWLSTIKNLAGNRRFHEWSSVVQVITDGLHGNIQTFLLRYSFQAVAYALWHERNVRRVGEPSLPADCLITRLDKLIRNRITSLRKKEGRKYKKAIYRELV